MHSVTYRVLKRVIIAFLILAATGWLENADASLQWSDVRPTVATRSIATDGSIYVSAAANGLFTSTDLTDWSRISLPTGAGQAYKDVIWSSADSEFVAVGPSTILTSPDGMTWTLRYQGAAGLGIVINSVIYANGSYIAVGSDTDGAISLSSADGMTWQLTLVAADPANTTLSFTGVAWGNGLYVAFGFSNVNKSVLNPNGAPGVDILYSSVDGITWASQILPQGGSDFYSSGAGNDAAFANGLFVAGGALGVYTSSDGTNWTATTLPPSGGPPFWEFNRIVAIGATFYATGIDFADPAYSQARELGIFSSSDGVNWTLHALNQVEGSSIFSVADIITGGSGFVAAGYSGAWTSPDGSTWSFLPSASAPILAECIGFDHGIITATGGGYSVTSTDGVHWSSATFSGLNGVYTLDGQGCMAGNGSLFALVTNFLPIYSSDGLSWSQSRVALQNLSEISGITYFNNQFYAVGQTSTSSPVEVSSADGQTWSGVNETGIPSDAIFGEPQNTAALISGGGKLIAWGKQAGTGQPFLAVTSDGTQWTTVSGLPAGLTSIAAVAYGGGVYVGIGTDATGNTLLMSSTDAISWTQIGNLPTGLQDVAWGSISYGGNTWLIAGVGGNTPGMLVVLTSADAKTWSLQSLGIGELLTPVSSTWDGSGFVVSSYYDILEAPVSTGGTSGGGGSGGGGSGTGAGGSGGGGTFGACELILLALCFSVRRYGRWGSLK